MSTQTSVHMDKNQNNSQPTMTILLQYFTEHDFAKGSIKHAELQAAQNDVYFYEFAYSGQLAGNTEHTYPGNIYFVSELLCKTAICEYRIWKCVSRGRMDLSLLGMAGKRLSRKRPTGA